MEFIMNGWIWQCIEIWYIRSLSTIRDWSCNIMWWTMFTPNHTLWTIQYAYGNVLLCIVVAFWRGQSHECTNDGASKDMGRMQKNNHARLFWFQFWTIKSGWLWGGHQKAQTNTRVQNRLGYQKLQTSFRLPACIVKIAEEVSWDLHAFRIPGTTCSRYTTLVRWCLRFAEWPYFHTNACIMANTALKMT